MRGFQTVENFLELLIIPINFSIVDFFIGSYNWVLVVANFNYDFTSFAGVFIGDNVGLCACDSIDKCTSVF